MLDIVERNSIKGATVRADRRLIEAADPVLSWMIFASVNLLAFVLLWFYGLAEKALTSDPTHITHFIILVYVATSLHCLSRCLAISREADAEKRLAASVSEAGEKRALPHEQVSKFIERLKTHDSVSARALEFAILTAARTGEVLGARFDEVDIHARLWTLAPDRMKAGRQHRVPLTDRAVAIAREMAKQRTSDFMFPGQRPGKPLSNMSLLMLLRDMGYGHFTVHGFRSTFRDWAAEKTNFPREVAEAALAHVVGDKVEAAYRRSDLFDKRRQLMNAWASHCR